MEGKYQDVAGRMSQKIADRTEPSRAKPIGAAHFEIGSGCF